MKSDSYLSGKKWEKNKESIQPLLHSKVPHFQKQMLNQHAIEGVKPHFRQQGKFLQVMRKFCNRILPTVYSSAI